MKKTLLLIILVGLTAISANAQRRTLKTEDNGFQWYNIVESDGTEGAESIDGKTLIPTSRRYTFICYHSGDYGYGYFGVEKNGKEGACNLKGKEIIAPERGYDNVVMHLDSPTKGYYGVEKNGKKGACDFNGKEIIAPYYNVLFHSIDGFNYKDSQGNYQPLGITLDDYDIASEYKPSKGSSKNKNQKDKQSKSSSSSSYASASITNFNLEHNVPNGGRTMMKANYNLEVKGCKGHKILVYLNIFNENKYRIMSVYSKSKAPYESTQWNNTWIGIYNDRINAQVGTHTYYAQLTVVDKRTKKTLANSELIEFEMTGYQQYYNYTPQYNIPPSNYQQQNNYNNNNNNQGSTYRISCTRCGGDGRCHGYGHTTAYYNMHCQGSGKCSTCFGKGYTINHYTGNNMVCPTCNGNGKCKQCRGTGVCQKCGGSGKE